MGAALESSPPAAIQRPKVLTAGAPLRAGEGSRKIHPKRRAARIEGGAEIAAARTRRGVTQLALARAFFNESDKFGAEVCAGAALGDGELVRLAPPLLAADVELERLRHAIARMQVELQKKPKAQTRLTMAMQHLALVETLVFAEDD